MIRTPTRADGAEPRGDILPDDIVTDMPLSPRNTSVPGNPSRSLAGTDTSAVRRLNTSAALRAILSVDGPATLAQLTAATSLSRRTIESILSELTLHGWVDELESRSSTGGAGRPSKRYSVRPQNALIAALRIDTFATTAVVSDVLGRELGRATRVLPDYFDPENTLATAAEALDAAIAETGLSATRIRGGALASGGAIEDESVIRHIVFAPTWSGVDARAALSLRFDFPWFVDNDANLAARAEHWAGAATDIDTFVWLILGNRAGAGILINGDIYSGFRGAAGEIVEAAGVVGLNDFDDHPIAWLTSPLDAQRAHALSRVAAARLGDPEALAEIDEFVTAVTPLLITLSWTIAPPLIVFGGGLEDAADLLLPRLEASMRVGNAPDIGLRASQLGLDAPLRGALKLVLDRLDSELFGPPSLPPKSLHD